ncbi:MAG: serine hydroxymethyltransferase [Chlamydiae bacterium SM23_39]|nr:MAG: serine hydroxymethyltransferase [Chlamydiae bacterium SM23_39]
MYLDKYLEKKGKNSGVIAFLAGLDHIQKISKEVADSIVQELKDQRSYLKMIASENYSSLAVQLAMGNLFTDKYSEGIPKKRFYAGCDNVDTVESLAIEEAKKIFGVDHVYVQPHSGADANMVAYWAIIIQKVQNRELEKFNKKLEELTDKEYEKIRELLINQKIMGMALSSGGHLTHGYRHNISSKMMISHSYEVDPKSCMLDYKKIQEKVKKEKPLILLAGYSSYPRLINFAKMKEIADSVKAVFMVDMAHFAGLVAGKVMKGEYNPVGYADIITSTTHKTLRGPRGGIILCTEEFKDVIDKGCPLVLGGPMPHVIAAKAIAFKEANSKEFCDYASNIVKNAVALAEKLKSLGAKIITDGTDNHLLLVDVNKSFGITGRQAEKALREAHITVNRNTIPLDENGPWYTSGIRIGTPAVTTLGMKEEQMKELGEIIFEILKNTRSIIKNGKKSKAEVEVDKNALEKGKDRIAQLLKEFPLYPEIII